LTFLPRPHPFHFSSVPRHWTGQEDFGAQRISSSAFSRRSRFLLRAVCGCLVILQGFFFQDSLGYTSDHGFFVKLLYIPPPALHADRSLPTCVARSRPVSLRRYCSVPRRASLMTPPPLLCVYTCLPICSSYQCPLRLPLIPTMIMEDSPLSNTMITRLFRKKVLLETRPRDVLPPLMNDLAMR